MNDATTVTALNLASRLTGFARVLIVGGALGATRLGDAFHASNQVSNLLFESLAAGTLSAVLVPGLVHRLTPNSAEDARAFAGLVLGRVLVVLVPIVVLGVVLAEPIARLLFTGNGTASFDRQVRLGAFLLLFVLPQLLLYAWGAVLTAVLHAAGRFAAAAFAPIANNIVVSAAVGAVWWRGANGLDLSLADQWLLGLGVLLGVLAMTLVPVVAAARAGLSVRPQWGTGPTVSPGDVLWASLVLLAPQAYLFGSLLVAGRVDGGVVACQIAFTLFLLPHALLGHPLATVLYPRIAAVVGEDKAAAARLATSGLTNLLQLTGGAAALIVASAPWLVEAVSLGALGEGTGPSLVAAALVGYVVGLPAYAWMLFATRVSYAHGDLRTPALASMVGGMVGASVLVAISASPEMTVRLIGFGHSLLMVVGVGLTVAALARRRAADVVLRPWLTVALSALVACAVARGVAEAVDGSGRWAALVTASVACAIGGAAYVGCLYACGVRTLPLHLEVPT